MWVVQRLIGAKALAKPIRNGLFKTPSAAAAALHGLIGVSFEDMWDVIEAVVHIVGAFAEHDDVGGKQGTMAITLT